MYWVVHLSLFQSVKWLGSEKNYKNYVWLGVS